MLAVPDWHLFDMMCGNLVPRMMYAAAALGSEEQPAECEVRDGAGVHWVEEPRLLLHRSESESEPTLPDDFPTSRNAARRLFYQQPHW